MNKFFYQFTVFQNEHIPQAADALVRQSAELRKRFPLLPERIQDKKAASSFLQALCEKSKGKGCILLQQNEIVSFILGYYDKNPFFGDYMWVPFGGIVLPHENSFEAFRALYTAAGELWIKDKILNHYLICPALDDWMQSAFSLSFGQEQVYAIAPLQGERDEISLPDGLSMREIKPSDAGQLAQKCHWIAEHLNRAPVWAPVPVEHMENIRAGYAELANDDTSTTWVALDGEEIVSYVCVYTEDIGAIHYLGVPQAAHFSIAATDPAYRGRGIGRALFTHILNIAREQGHDRIFTDWRITNLEASRYWPTFGFEPFSYRLLRRVNPAYQPFTPPD